MFYPGSYSTGRASAVGFSIGNKGYLGTGYDYTGFIFSDFWEYDPSTDSWAQKANFGGGSRAYAVGFSIGNFGFVGTGEIYSTYSPAFDSLYNDFWRYDPSVNTWTQVASLPSNKRKQAMGFTIGGKGYVGTGGDATTNFSDFWEYDPVNNTWTQKMNYLAGQKRKDIDRAVFVIYSKAYTCGGYDTTKKVYNDVWQYDQNTSAWTQKANLPGLPRRGAVGFSICVYGFIGTGLNDYTPLNDFYMYNPYNNTWSTALSFPDYPCWDAQSFVINNKAYVMTGNRVDQWSGDPTPMQDLWEFSEPPLIATICPNTTVCAGTNVSLSVNGGATYLWSTGETTKSIYVSPDTTTTYWVTVSSQFCFNQTLSTTVSVINSANSLFTYSYDPCKNNCVSFTDQSTNALTWDWDFADGNSSSSQSSCHSYHDSSTYNVSLIINNSTNCVDTFSVQVPYVTHDTSAFVYIPNAFSPNVDGSNDVLAFYKKDIFCLKEFELTIYDRWGEQVFITTNINSTWDGNLNEKKLDSQVLSYYCKTITVAGKQLTQKGNISLVR